MAAKVQPDQECIKMAVDITKSILEQDNSLLRNSEHVASFLEAITYKLADLRFGQRQ